MAAGNCSEIPKFPASRAGGASASWRRPAFAIAPVTTWRPAKRPRDAPSAEPAPNMFRINSAIQEFFACRSGRTSVASLASSTDLGDRCGARSAPGAPLQASQSLHNFLYSDIKGRVASSDFHVRCAPGWRPRSRSSGREIMNHGHRPSVARANRQDDARSQPRPGAAVPSAGENQTNPKKARRNNGLASLISIHIRPSRRACGG
jgi:hypothetical protein